MNPCTIYRWICRVNGNATGEKQHDMLRSVKHKRKYGKHIMDYKRREHWANTGNVARSTNDIIWIRRKAHHVNTELRRSEESNHVTLQDATSSELVNWFFSCLKSTHRVKKEFKHTWGHMQRARERETLLIRDTHTQIENILSTRCACIVCSAGIMLCTFESDNESWMLLFCSVVSRNHFHMFTCQRCVTVCMVWESKSSAKVLTYENEHVGEKTTATDRWDD